MCSSDLLKLIQNFKGMARCQIGSGMSVYFWHDSCLNLQFPRLFSFAKNPQISVSSAAQLEYFEDMFNLPLSNQAFQEFLQLEILWESLQQRIQLGSHDSWSYIWGSDKFSASKAYHMMLGKKDCPPHFSWIWNTPAKLSTKCSSGSCCMTD